MTEANARNRERHVLSGTRGSGNFDVRSWQGLTSVLKAGRDAGMDADTYSAFRDTVLQYAQSRGTDKDLRTQIEATLATFGKTIPKADEPPVEANVEAKSAAVEVPQKETVVPQRTSFGSGRPSPQFSAPESAPKETQSQEPPEPPQPPKVQHEAPVNLPIHTEVPIRKVVPAPEPEAVAPPRAQDETKTISDYKERIDQIKHTINAEIGNPTALLSETNEVGRQYMQALVAAMKAVAGAAPGTLSSSMQRLEELFPKVLDAAKNHRTEKTSPPPPKPEPVVEKEIPVEKPVEVGEPVPEPIPEEPPHIESIPEPAPQVDVVERVEEEPKEEIVVPEVPIEVSKPPEPEVRDEKPVEPEVPEVVAEEIPLPPPSPKKDPEPVAVVIPPRVEVKDVPPEPKKISVLPSLHEQLATQQIQVKQEVPTVVEKEELPKPIPKPLPAPVVVPPENLPILKKEINAEEKSNIKEVESEPIPERTPAVQVEAETAVAQSVVTRRGPKRPTLEVHALSVEKELNSPEIDAGLSEILNTWKLFRGGGIFGIKKAGLENSLYQKLKDEPMSVVATGRWDGADQEAILSMRDYISGWRQEQGMWYVPSETFENYLRRVIRRVLKRQENG
ncbi:hypothetical protein GW943_00755 [Candidatus Parcubacteria bacterium]|uniref:Uncharacterized protein n=1 Tax=Candidatus Kaiserbacteria bacterium CG10_big_fil_rev_8_21_14_0_10_47_16 TaxID=1974608 RepID=A0A2H0UDE2_9BACT|nr:hypothetical protein [Candidatus Parcubacteria bacterium]PIR84370.1 MAG: hypothetical protein COU16_02140 [Candidatus Kaiserbacteria bacterium CG10_big_fil_rev_8_21_14_0_10_47_16]